MSEPAPRTAASPTPPRHEVRLTSSDIARLSGVSVSAVSLALNGRPGVSEATRARIVAVADEYNWRPHRAARALKGATSDVAGLVIARPARTLGVEPFFAQLLSGLQSRLSQDAIALQLLIVEDTDAEIATYRRWAAENRVGGTVLLDLVENDPRPEVVERLGIPAVAVGGAGEAWPVTSVWADDYGAMRAMLSHLVDLGHRAVGYVGGTAAFEHSRRRSKAVADLADEHGLEVTSIATDFSDEQGASATRRLLTSRNRPTAVIYDSDVMAVAGLAVANELGIAVPQDVSIASFDDSVLTRLTHPALTSLTRDTFALGALVAKELITTVATGGQRPVSIQAPTPHLTVRASTVRPGTTAD
ncbi:LacI family DNA-binding transcriptional regulator [Microbacterium sp. VKM Ac-2923]|uniref:LacI family DNA-binding transcriptional regulator n=1 Tax=Microbacterium sp. VKM Ac-2923 TaxID=2929476 RepID=UPI001FB1B957|nr:LacI family DNA-binding transcriptional regulator [Microbacterium sp. VKM Ac-2923]MCJ1708759.1 LacI family transcriptional regulator [Microbacterium sp. VKM Ac-2923]